MQQVEGEREREQGSVRQAQHHRGRPRLLGGFHRLPWDALQDRYLARQCRPSEAVVTNSVAGLVGCTSARRRGRADGDVACTRRTGCRCRPRVAGERRAAAGQVRIQSVDEVPGDLSAVDPYGAHESLPPADGPCMEVLNGAAARGECNALGTHSRPAAALLRRRSERKARTRRNAD